MTDAEKEAMEWLRGLIGAFPSRSDPAITLLALLAEPRLPAEPSEELLLAMRRSEIVPSADWRDHFLHAYRALYAELTAPRTKTETFVRWLVVNPRDELGPYAVHSEAVRIAAARGGTVIELTGKGEVPA